MCVEHSMALYMYLHTSIMCLFLLCLCLHYSSAHGSAEVSSANYEAREFGIHAGMFMAEAKRLCPDLLVVPYEFERYTEVSEQVGFIGGGEGRGDKGCGHVNEHTMWVGHVNRRVDGHSWHSK